MDKISCITEKYSSRVIGLIILPLALALGFLGFLIVPVVGLIFSVPPVHSCIRVHCGT
jgi:hypothetical protein